MQEFKISRALGLSFRLWFRNFIPFTLLTAALYAPVFLWVATIDLESARSLDELLDEAFIWPLYAVIGLATLLAPMLTYRVVQDLNGVRVSMLMSMKHGVRGFVPALLLAVAGYVLQLIPGGALIGAVLWCVYFVAAPAAVAERLGPIAALARSSELTRGRRWGIFGLTFLIGLAMGALLLAWLLPGLDDTEDLVANIRPTAIIFVCAIGVCHLFNGIVEAVSYALLRQDKDGVSHGALAEVFE